MGCILSTYFQVGHSMKEPQNLNRPTNLDLDVCFVRNRWRNLWKWPKKLVTNQSLHVDKLGSFARFQMEQLKNNVVQPKKLKYQKQHDRSSPSLTKKPSKCKETKDCSPLVNLLSQLRLRAIFRSTSENVVLNIQKDFKIAKDSSILKFPCLKKLSKNL